MASIFCGYVGVHVMSEELYYAWNDLPQLVEAMRYKVEGRGFDARWCHCNLSLT